MALVVNKSQQVTSAGLRPASAYSRILTAYCDAGPLGGWGFGFTPTFGQQTRLLGIKVVSQIAQGGPVEIQGFTLHRGTVEPASRQDVQGWDSLIDFPANPTVVGMIARGEFRQFSWDLSRVFVNEVNRFGVVLNNVSTNIGTIHAFFHIAEG